MRGLVEMTSIGIDRLTDMMTFEQKTICTVIAVVAILILTFVGHKIDPSDKSEEQGEQDDGDKI